MEEGPGRGSGRVGSDFLSAIAGRVGSGQSFAGSGRVGSKKCDPWTTLWRIQGATGGHGLPQTMDTIFLTLSNTNH